METSWSEGPRPVLGRTGLATVPVPSPKTPPRKLLLFSMYTRDFEDHTLNVSTAFWKIDKVNPLTRPSSQKKTAPVSGTDISPQ